MLEGFVFIGAWDKEKTPLDYLTDPKSGLRGNSMVKPRGWIAHDLTVGCENMVLPPVGVWNKGMWLSDMSKKNSETFRAIIPEDKHFSAYLVAGEGTPGNYAVRIYLIPKGLQNEHSLTHPTLWSAFHQKGEGQNIYENSQKLGWGGYTKAETPKTEAPKTTTAKPLPVRLRIRCADCGHWWKMDDLGVHNEHCCPGKEGSEFSDWAILCECCDTLDEVSQVKPGFPRPKKEAKKTEAKPTVEKVTA